MTILNRCLVRVCLILVLPLVFANAAPTEMLVNAGSADTSVNWQAFLSQHDLIWDRLPNRWEVAPFTGNGNVGFLFYQAEGEDKNVLSIHAGRHDYYDHRLPHDGKEMLWIYRSRLPFGHFRLISRGHQIGGLAFESVERRTDGNSHDFERLVSPPWLSTLRS